MIRPAFDGALFAFGFTLLTAGSALGQFLPVADTSAMVPGGATGEVFLSISGGSTSLSGSAVAFRGTGDMGTQGVYTDVGGALSPVADTATIVPGGAPGETFSSFGNGRPSLAGGAGAQELEVRSSVRGAAHYGVVDDQAEVSPLSKPS